MQDPTFLALPNRIQPETNFTLITTISTGTILAFEITFLAPIVVKIVSYLTLLAFALLGSDTVGRFLFEICLFKGFSAILGNLLLDEGAEALLIDNGPFNRTHAFTID